LLGRGGRIGAIIEVVLQILCEAVLQVVAEIALELGLEGLARVANRTRTQHPLLALLGYSMLGATVGAFSLYPFPASFIRVDSWRVLNLVITPVLAGGLMAGIGKLRGRHRGAHTRLSTFLSGFGFALAMAAVRYFWSRTT
jgi:hypothetical protein